MLAERLVQDQPSLFGWRGNALDCAVTEALVHFNHDYTLENLVWQIQADFALVKRFPDGTDRIVTILVTAPSHWRPRDKLGLSFFESHTVVPGFERVNATASKMVDAMISKGPFIRFVWGIDSDDRLNHHPDPPPGEDPVTWKGRNFESGDLFVRYERQTLLGVPEVDAAIFLIHAKTLPIAQLNKDQKATLRSAVESMSEAALSYKGFLQGRDHLLRRLNP